jgi:four helix bundle protein
LIDELQKNTNSIKYNKMNDEFKENVIINLTFEFALKVIDFCDELDNKKKFALSNQLFKSGTSIGANAREAQNAESKADFIHKFKISAKEVEETEYWLLLCKHSKKLPESDYLLTDLEPIKKIISKIIGTSKRT